MAKVYEVAPAGRGGNTPKIIMKDDPRPGVRVSKHAGKAMMVASEGNATCSAGPWSRHESEEAAQSEDLSDG